MQSALPARQQPLIRCLTISGRKKEREEWPGDGGREVESRKEGKDFHFLIDAMPRYHIPAVLSRTNLSISTLLLLLFALLLACNDSSSYYL